MTKLARRRRGLAFLLPLVLAGGLIAAPIPSRADGSQGSDTEKKGPAVPIKVGSPIIIKDKKPAPQVPKK